MESKRHIMPNSHNIRLSAFEVKYLTQMGELFAQEFSEPGYEFSADAASKYLLRSVQQSPDYCFLAFKEGISKPLGGIFCQVLPYYQSKSLFVTAVLVDPKYRNMGVGKSLLYKVIELAKKNRLETMQLMADNRKDFPINWYKKLGLEENGWVEMEVHLDKVKI